SRPTPARHGTATWPAFRASVRAPCSPAMVERGDTGHDRQGRPATYAGSFAALCAGGRTRPSGLRSPDPVSGRLLAPRPRPERFRRLSPKRTFTFFNHKTY